VPEDWIIANGKHTSPEKAVRISQLNPISLTSAM